MKFLEEKIKSLMNCKRVLEIKNNYFLCVNEFQDNAENEVQHYHYEWCVGEILNNEIVNNSCHYFNDYNSAKQYFLGKLEE